MKARREALSSWLKLDDCLWLDPPRLPNGFLKLWFTVLVSTAMSPIHCFILCVSVDFYVSVIALVHVHVTALEVITTAWSRLFTH